MPYDLRNMLRRRASVTNTVADNSAAWINIVACSKRAIYPRGTNRQTDMNPTRWPSMLELPKSRRDWLRSTTATSVAASLALSSQTQAEPTKRKPIRIGQIGTGHAHANKLGVYRQSPDYEVIGIVEEDPEMRRRAQSDSTYKDLPWMTQEQLLNQPELEAVLVETRVRDSLNVAEMCVKAGKHIHLDKPAGESLDQFSRILESANAQGLLVQMGYMYRYNPAVVMLRNFLAEGWLGEIFEVHAVMSKVIGPAERASLSEYRGGTMFELGCHLIDLVVGVLGRPEAVTPFVRESGVGPAGWPDNMLAVLEYKHATATVKSTAVEVEGFTRRHFVACGTKGTFHIQPLDRPKVTLALDEPQGEFRKGVQEISMPPYTRYVDDAADMARIIRGEKQSDFSVKHDLAVQDSVLKASRIF